MGKGFAAAVAFSGMATGLTTTRRSMTDTSILDPPWVVSIL
jgi:hypothetical protein